MRGIVQSYRWRRRLAWIGSSVALLVGLVVAALLLPKDHGVRYQLNPTGTEAVQSYAPLQKEVRELKSQQYTNRVDRSVGRLENFRLIPEARRRLAVVLTILKEKELASASSKGGK